MPPIYIFEDSHSDRLYPLTLSRPPCLLRCGAYTLLERIQTLMDHPLAGLLVRPGLAEVTHQQTRIPVNPPVSTRDGILLINSRWLMLPSESPFAPANFPSPDSAGLASNTLAWVHLSAATAAGINFSQLHELRTLEAVLPNLTRTSTQATLINRLWDLLEHQKTALLADWPRFGAKERGNVLPGVHQISPENIHVGHNVKLYPGTVLDGSTGPIILEGSEDPAHPPTEIQAHSLITGPVYIGPHCVIRAHADIRPDCSFGPHSRIGGEVGHSIFFGYSNKQHLGFMGQSIVGMWANLGAGTTTSNLKNTYGTVRVPINGTEEDTGRQFMGTIVADHAKIGIGTYLSTGTVVGFASHVIAPRPPKFVPSFAWVATSKTGVPEISRIDFDKIVTLAKTVTSRRHVNFTQADHDLFVRIAGEYTNQENYNWKEAPRSTGV